MTSLAAFVFTAGLLLLLLVVWLAAVSWQECEWRAVRRTLLAVTPLAVLLLLSGWNNLRLLNLLLASLLLISMATLLIPVRRGQRSDNPSGRLDERDTVFSRSNLQPGSIRYAEYYHRHPQRRVRDDAMRALPGLLASTSSQYNQPIFEASRTLHTSITELRQRVEGEPAPQQTVIEPATALRLVRGWALNGGAVACGVTPLRDYHFYSNGGRGENYDRPITSNHTGAIVLAVEMDRGMVVTAPGPPVILESYRRYLQVGRLAVEMANSIRNMGWSARAHIDGDYQLLCPLVARDAGLGEIGRMGVLMTPHLGPRVRLAAVTTTMPLTPTGPAPTTGVIEFCNRCNKCVTACPSEAIPSGNRQVIDGVRRWRINSEACYDLWCRIGTDCCRCVSVCPWSHPDNLLHNLVRTGVRHSAMFRRLAVPLDDLLYGKQPAAKPPPPEIRALMQSGTGNL